MRSIFEEPCANLRLTSSLKIISTKPTKDQCSSCSGKTPTISLLQDGEVCIYASRCPCDPVLPLFFSVLFYIYIYIPYLLSLYFFNRFYIPIAYDKLNSILYSTSCPTHTFSVPFTLTSSEMSLFTMCCGSRKDNYYTVRPYRPPKERPHPSVSQNQPRRQQPQFQPQPQPRSRGPEELEKRRRQAQATAAARTYGWPTERGVVAGNMRNNRDSIIEPDLAGGLAAMPGSDFRAVYDPQRPRHISQRQQQQQRQKQQKPTITHQQHISHQKWKPQRPSYYQQQFVDRQPSSMAPMRAAPSRQTAPSVTQRQQRQRPAVGRVLPVVPTRPPVQVPPPRKVKRPVRRDSNGVSECSSSSSDDDDGDHRRHRRNYNVSPLHSPERE